LRLLEALEGIDVAAGRIIRLFRQLMRKHLHLGYESAGLGVLIGLVGQEEEIGQCHENGNDQQHDQKRIRATCSFFSTCCACCRAHASPHPW
jgi:hypothetical protein